MQGENETVNDYITALCTLVADCDIQDNISESRQLAMQLVIGCRAKLSQEKLLAEQTADLDKFLTIMRADESATQTTAAMQQENTIAMTARQQLLAHNKRTKQQTATAPKQKLNNALAVVQKRINTRMLCAQH